METYWLQTTEKQLFRALKMSFSLFLICIFSYDPMLKILLRSLLLPHLRHNKSLRQQMWLLLPLSQTTAEPQAAPKPKVIPKQDELNRDSNIENEMLVPLYQKRDLRQPTKSDHKEI